MYALHSMFFVTEGSELFSLPKNDMNFCKNRRHGGNRTRKTFPVNIGVSCGVTFMACLSFFFQALSGSFVE